MPTNDYIQPVFNIKGACITHSYRKDNLLIYEVMLPVTEHTCPYCGYTTKYIKDYRVHTINLGSIHGLYICAKYKQRRYSCPQCTHSFSEENPFIQRYKQLGMTTITEIFRLLHEGLNYTTIARVCHVSVTTVIRYCSLISISRPKELPTVLGIDEFRGNVAGQKYQVILTDPDSHHIIDVLSKKDTNALCRYFASYSRKARQKVRFIVMDMSPQFRLVMETLFPQAHIVCDRYHVCRLVDWAVERVRKREQKKLVRYSAMLKSNKRILMKHPGRLTDAELIKLEESLRVSDDLRKAYKLKQEFIHIFERQGKERITYHLEWWLKSVKTAQLTEFRNFSTSFVSWKGQITNAFLLPFSTGYTEGCNNKIKVLKRISYGLRHFGHFRTRILLLSKKNGTEHKGIRCRKKLVDQLDPNICKRAYFLSYKECARNSSSE